MIAKEETTGSSFGKCPACQGDIIEGKKGYGCRNWRDQDGGCRFVVWKEIAGTKITPATLRVLLSKGCTPAMTFQSAEGGRFTAALKIAHDEEENKWHVNLDFSNKTVSADADAETTEIKGLGQCPRCGGVVEEGNRGFGCQNWRNEDGGCKFVIWKTIAGKELSIETVKALLTKGEAGVINGFISKKGKEFSAGLRLEGEDFKTVFVFSD